MLAAAGNTRRRADRRPAFARRRAQRSPASVRRRGGRGEPDGGDHSGQTYALPMSRAGRYAAVYGPRMAERRRKSVASTAQRSPQIKQTLQTSGRVAAGRCCRAPTSTSAVAAIGTRRMSRRRLTRFAWRETTSTAAVCECTTATRQKAWLDGVCRGGRRPPWRRA